MRAVSIGAVDNFGEPRCLDQEIQIAFPPAIVAALQKRALLDIGESDIPSRNAAVLAQSGHQKFPSLRREGTGNRQADALSKSVEPMERIESVHMLVPRLRGGCVSSQNYTSFLFYSF